MLINPEEMHDGWASEKKQLDYVMVYIKPEKFLDLLESKEMIKFSDPIIFDPKLMNNILDFTSSVINEKEDALCSESLVSLINNFSPSLIDKEYSSDDSLIKKSKDIINSNLGEVLKLDDVSAEFGMSKYQFIRAFKSVSGLSPYQYYINSKIEKSRELLDKYKDVYSAVAELDFTDLTHLNRHFKTDLRCYCIGICELRELKKGWSLPSVTARPCSHGNENTQNTTNKGLVI